MRNKVYYSAKNNGFYPESLKESYKASKTGWPDDAIEITADEYKALLSGQESGKVITADKDGKPVLSDPVIDYNATAERQRQALLSEANTTTADWRTELQLDVISDDDKASLIKWMAYIKAVKALDLSGVTDKAAYDAIQWPDKP